MAANGQWSMKKIATSIAVAAVLWFLMFSPWTAPYLPFWWCMTASACVLTTLALTFGGKDCLGIPSKTINPIDPNSPIDPINHMTELFFGLAIAVGLWVAFFVGDKVSQWMFDFARPQVNLIYGMKDGMSPLTLSLLLLCVIGPAEEIFWRGFIQRSLSARYSPTLAFIVTTAIYTLVHLPSGNFMLIMAALVCGIAWGGLYWLWPNRLPSIIISHAVWDAAAFVWFPF